MNIRFLILCVLLTMGSSAHATDRLLLKFELAQGDKILYWGKTYVSGKPNTWSTGLRSSYLRLRCHLVEPGKLEKRYSTEDHFSGLRVTHRLAGGNMELTVIRSDVQARLAEIRALSKRECRDLSPVVTTTTEAYSFPAKDGVDESHPFGNNMIFRVTLQSVVIK